MKKILKRISCFMIVFLLVFTSVLSTLSIGRSSDNSIVLSTKADTDSNDRRKALIKMAAGKNANELNKEGLLTLSDDELQTIGIFLSNFYKPMQTCVNASESEINKKLEEQEINALVSCGFDKDIATALAKAVKKYSSSTALDAKNRLKYKRKYNTKIHQFGKSGKEETLTYNAGQTASRIESVQQQNGGVSNSYSEVSIDTKLKYLENISGGSYDNASYVDFVYATLTGGELIDSNNKTIVDFGTGAMEYGQNKKGYLHLTSSSIPPATAMMLGMVFNTMDITNNVGVSIFNFVTEKEVNETFFKETFLDNKNNLTKEQMERLHIKNSVLSMDCFGNIICDVGTGQYVLVPACANPYVFQTKGEGSETLNTYNLTNLQTIYNWARLKRESKSLYSSDKGKKKDIENVMSLDLSQMPNFSYILGDESTWKFCNKGIDKFDNTDDWTNTDIAVLGTGKKFENYLYDGSFLGLRSRMFIESQQRIKITVQDVHTAFKGRLEVPYLPSYSNGVNDVNLYSKVNCAEHGSQYTKNGKLKTGYCADFLTLDDLGTYEGDEETGESIVYQKIFNYADISNMYSSISVDSSTDNYYSTITDSAKIYAQNIFLTYVYMFSNYKNNTWDARGVTCKLNLGDALPKPNAKNVFADIEIDTTQQLLDEGLSLAVLWMHPEKGLELVTAWVNNKVSSVLTGVHEKILGSNIANNTTATNKYIGFSGYVTMPELNDLSWTAAILEKYNSYSVLIIVIMIILLFGYAMIGRIAPFKIVTTGLIFAFLMALPPVLINGTISITNQFSDRLYGQKFIYWGLVQHENYISDINEAANSGSYEDYLTTLFKQRYAENNSTSSNVSIRLKWMCPKKDNYVQNLKETVEGDTGSAFFSQIVGALSNSSGITHEDYSESDNKVYLYRSYTDISNWARYTYMAYAGEEDWVEQSVDGVPSIKKYTDGNLKTAKDLGFNYKGVADDPLNRLNPLNCSATIKEYLDKYTSSDAIRKKANLDTFLGIPTESFKALNQINNGEADVEDLAITYFSELSESPFYFFAYNLYDQGMNWEDDDATEGFKCLALNESFDNANSVTNNDVEEGDDGTEDNSDNESGVVNPDVADTIDEVKGMEEGQEKEAAEMGDETNDGYFYNMSQGIVDKGGNGYGEIRDYMDMRTLFTVVIPYLKECNDMVLDYDKAFGLRTYDGYSYDPKDSSNYETKEDKRKFWVNVCTAQMFNLYTPWVDAMYDCKYAKSESVRVAGEKEFIEDPLNPADYPKERPMIFSESERVYYGIKETQLTSVEQKIIEIEKNSYERLFQLMNYYTFHDTVITSAAAMIETFEFNKTFSQDSFLSDSYVLYPQAYELKNFSYDAFLRLILAQSTGEEIQASASDGSLTNKGGNIYERVVKNSNMFCGLMLILNDAICIWLIPLAKFAFLLLIFTMSIVMLISCIIKIDISNMQATITKSLITPLAKFLALTIGHSFVVSCFMSEGNTAVTGATSPAITLGDPTMTLILMAIINGVVIFLFLKILIKLIRDTVTYVKAIGQDVIGMAGGVLTMATGAVRNAYNGARGVGRGALGGLFAAGAGLAAGAALTKGLGSKIKNRGGNKGGSTSGSGTGSDDGSSSADSLKTSKRKERRKDTSSSGTNKYDEGIKNSKVKEAATSSVDDNKSNGKNKKDERKIANRTSTSNGSGKKGTEGKEKENNYNKNKGKNGQKSKQRKNGRNNLAENSKNRSNNNGSKKNKNGRNNLAKNTKNGSNNKNGNSRTYNGEHKNNNRNKYGNNKKKNNYNRKHNKSKKKQYKKKCNNRNNGSKKNNGSGKQRTGKA